MYVSSNVTSKIYKAIIHNMGKINYSTITYLDV